MLTRTTKLKLVVPVLIYGAEAWTLTDSDEKMLDLFERKVLRMIYGPVCIEGEWRTSYNHELYLLYGEATVTRNIRTQRLRVLERNPEGRRGIGRPKLRWKDSVFEDYQKLGAGLAWRTAALDRTTLCYVMLIGSGFNGLILKITHSSQIVSKTFSITIGAVPVDNLKV